uniref:Reverse transcriptase domain-containing protein n=1 Tax=Anopheles atroparvus TaxID=41427 RepID=A0A182JH33_ANOAO
MSLGNRSVSSPQAISNLFAEHFAWLFVDPARSTASLSSGVAKVPRDALSIDTVTVDVPSVIAELTQLKCSYSPGPDGIPSSVLIHGREAFAPILARLFARSIREGSFPALWASAWMVPVHKKGCRTDLLSLQSFADAFSAWCVASGLVLCVAKCCVISFGRSRDKLLHSYCLSGLPLPRVTVVKNLGVWLDDRLSFGAHLDSVVEGACRMLGLISRMTSEIRDPLCLRALYCCWVRPKLDYASVIWSPAGVTAMDRLEKVQRKFTRVAVRRFLNDHTATLPPYPARCRLLGLVSVKDHHSHARSLLIANILQGNMDSPTLLAAIPLYHVSRGLPHAHWLVILADSDKPQSATDYDRLVFVEIPDPANVELHETICNLMMHG